MTQLLLDITLACKFIAREINQSAIKDLHDVRRVRETPERKMQRLEAFAAEQMNYALSRSATTFSVYRRSSPRDSQVWCSLWSEGVKAYLEHATAKQYGFRYAGSMVSDIHRIPGILPLHIHQTTPIFIGSPGNVSEAVSMLSN